MVLRAEGRGRTGLLPRAPFGKGEPPPSEGRPPSSAEDRRPSSGDGRRLSSVAQTAFREGFDEGAYVLWADIGRPLYAPALQKEAELTEIAGRRPDGPRAVVGGHETSQVGENGFFQVRRRSRCRLLDRGRLLYVAILHVAPLFSSSTSGRPNEQTRTTPHHHALKFQSSQAGRDLPDRPSRLGDQVIHGARTKGKGSKQRLPIDLKDLSSLPRVLPGVAGRRLLRAPFSRFLSRGENPLLWSTDRSREMLHRTTARYTPRGSRP